MFESEKEVLPAFPKTPHLPHKPNTDRTDAVASEEEAAVVFNCAVNVEEKIDGASCGMVLYNGEPLIRNRDHILRKGYVKDTAAKKQFASVWNWFYENKKRFQMLADIGPYSVYGEWCIAQHGIHYTSLPDWFIPYDLYDYDKKLWVEPVYATALLLDAGFKTPKLHHRGWDFEGGYEKLEELANEKSRWADCQAEGVYLKVYDTVKITHRFKMVRHDFVRGALWNPEKYTKNGRA